MTFALKFPEGLSGQYNLLYMLFLGFLFMFAVGKSWCFSSKSFPILVKEQGNQWEHIFYYLSCKRIPVYLGTSNSPIMELLACACVEGESLVD